LKKRTKKLFALGVDAVAAVALGFIEVLVGAFYQAVGALRVRWHLARNPQADADHFARRHTLRPTNRRTWRQWLAYYAAW
jgi:hypothetical protein